jgi:hypothetical protein
MTNYLDWDTDDASVSSLLLDPHNPRLGPTGSALSPSQMIPELLEHEQVDELVRDIAENGWIPGDSLCAIEEDDTLIVVEGNRRLAALKLLLDPGLAPESWKRKLKPFAKSRSSVPDTVRVVIAPSREAAAPLVLRRHTKGAIHGWDLLMQARFLRSLAQGGLFTRDLVSRYGNSLSGKVNELLPLLYQLLLQIPSSSPADFANLLDLEAAMGSALGDAGEVDGHDVGSGETNIFVFTEQPIKVFTTVMARPIAARVANEIRAAYRAVGASAFTVIHLPGLTSFRIS